MEKSIKFDDFNNFITNINKTRLLMDNTIIHHSKLFKGTIKKNKLLLIYGIPYYFKYNPIEYIFSFLRNEIQNDRCNSENEIINTINKFIININNNIYF